MCYKKTFLWPRFMKTFIRCALQYVTDKYVHKKKSERVNLWDFLIIGGKLWEKSTFNLPPKKSHICGTFSIFCVGVGHPTPRCPRVGPSLAQNTEYHPFSDRFCKIQPRILLKNEKNSRQKPG